MKPDDEGKENQRSEIKIKASNAYSRYPRLSFKSNTCLLSTFNDPILTMLLRLLHSHVDLERPCSPMVVVGFEGLIISSIPDSLAST